MTPEAIWLTGSVLGFALTLFAVLEARKDAIAVRVLNGDVVGIAVRGAYFQERARLLVQFVFLAVGLIAVADPRDAPMTPTVALLLTVPVILAVNTVRSLIDRRAVRSRGAKKAMAERDHRMDRLEDQGSTIEAKLDANTALTQQASDNANAAYEVANNVNERISAQDVVIIEQGANAAADRLIGADTNETAHRIDERVP